ncbi:MAG: N-acetylneuraminate synthase family protein [archaeon]
MRIQIGKVIIGDDVPAVVIAEACDNHHGNLEEAKALACSAKEAGAKIIKFQLHLPDEEMHRQGMKETSSQMFSKWGDLYGFIKQNLLSVEDHKKLIKYCNEIGIQYFCTPFSLKAAQILREIGGDAAFKIGSGETEDLPMIEEVAAMGRPMILSTGMSTISEIDLSVNAMRKEKIPFALMHCISAYPPRNETELHLGTIRELKERYKVPIGFSDHTSPDGIKTASGEHISEEAIIWAAMAMGARFIEKHFTMDRNAKDADSRFSHDGKTLKRLIGVVNAADSAFAGGRDIFEHEKDVWIWAKRSLVAAKDLKAGEVLSRDKIVSKRPGTGIRSKDYKKAIGKKLKRNISAGEMIKWEDLA